MVSVGDLVYAAIKPIIRMYLIMGAGIYLARAGFLSVETTRAISDLVLIYFMPTLIFYEIVSYISISDLKEIGVIFLSATVFYAINATMASINVTVNPVPKYWKGGAILAGILQNVSDLPIAYLQSIASGFVFTTEQGDKGVAYVLIWLAVYVLAQFNFGLFQLVELDFRRYDRDTGNGDMYSLSEDEEHNIHNDHARVYGNPVIEEEPEEITNTPVNSTVSPDNGSKVEDQTQTQRPSNGTSTAMLHDNSLHPSSFDNEGELVSPTSTISEETSISSSVGDRDEVNSGDRNTDLMPRPLLSHGSRNSNKLQPILSHHSVVRIPSARSHSNTYVLATPSSARTSLDSAQPVSISGLSTALSIGGGIRPRRASNTSSIARVLSHDSGSTTNRSVLMAAPTFTDALVREYSRAEVYNQNLPTSIAIATETNLAVKDVQESGKNIKFVQKYRLQWLVFVFKNFMKPNAISIIVSLTVALVPWLKALFVNGGPRELPNAPDHAPALSFILQFAQYSSQPCVPIGLLLLGTTIGRLEINSIPKGFWRCVLFQVIYRLCISPIIGVFWVKRLMHIGWINDPMAGFVTALEFGLPSATVQVYLTASNMTPDREDKTQMDCLALYVLAQYIVLFVSLPFLVVCMLKLILKV